MKSMTFSNLASLMSKGFASGTVKTSGVVFAVRLLGMFLTFLTTFVLAKLLNADSFGDYAWALSWITVMRLVVSLGFDKLVVRDVAVYLARRDDESAHGVVVWCRRATLVACLIVLPLTVLLGYIFAKPNSSQFGTLAFAIIALPLMALMTTQQAAVQGHHKIIGSRLPEDIVYPATFLVIVLLSFVYWRSSLNSITTTNARNLALLLAVVVAFWILRANQSSSARRVLPSREQRRRNWKSSLPLVIIDGSNILIVEFGTIVVGAARGSSAAGSYSVAVRIAFTLTLIQFAVMQAITPSIATGFANDRANLQARVSQAATFVIVVAVAGGLVLAVFATDILALFGPTYTSSAWVLRALVLAWLINLACGPNGLVLVMGGREQTAAFGLAAGAVVSIPLTIALTWVWGEVGAAISTALSMLVWNSVLARQCWKIWGIDTLAFGAISALKGRRVES